MLQPQLIQTVLHLPLCHARTQHIADGRHAFIGECGNAAQGGDFLRLLYHSERLHQSFRRDTGDILRALFLEHVLNRREGAQPHAQPLAAAHHVHQIRRQHDIIAADVHRRVRHGAGALVGCQHGRRPLARHKQQHIRLGLEVAPLGGVHRRTRENIEARFRRTLPRVGRVVQEVLQARARGVHSAVEFLFTQFFLQLFNAVIGQHNCSILSYYIIPSGLPSSSCIP